MSTAAARRPIIAVSCYVESATYGPWTQVPAVVLAMTYVRQLREAGATPVVVPPVADDDEAASILRAVDGLVLAGGTDIEAHLYGEHASPQAQPARPDRDASELALARMSTILGTPTLGICRGMQVMAVAAGGSLHQHLPERVGHTRHSPGVATYGTTVVEVAPQSRLAAIIGDRAEVSCYHHQGVSMAPGYDAVARSADEVWEAMEIPSASFRLAVQWHPEVGSDPRLFRALVEAAGGFADRRVSRTPP